MTDQYLHPEAIASTAWLDTHIDDDDLRLFECTTYLDPPPPGSDASYSVRNASVEFALGHIPNANLIDLEVDLCDQTSAPHLRFMMPSLEALSAAFAALGIADDCAVVLYSRGSAMWATRVWWMLRAIGFDNASVLDGGWEKWLLDGRVTNTQTARHDAGVLSVKNRAEVFVGKIEMQAAMGDASACSVNALSADVRRGESGRYGRRGRIPGSVNVPYSTLVDGTDQTFLSPKSVAASLQAVGADPEKRCFVYCGGGIAASLDAFLMYQLGFENVSIYDASLSEWARDESLPMETD